MAKNNNQNDAFELWGREFKKVDGGLDKGEVVSFVNELMKKHEALLDQAEHLSSLTKLAEKTIVEADNVAKQVQTEAEERAKNEAKKIFAEAEEQAQQIIEEKKIEALARANREAEAIKAKAQQQAATMLEEKIKEIQPELKNNAKRLYKELLAQLDSLKEQVAGLESELDDKLSEPPAETEELNPPAARADRADNEFFELLRPAGDAGEGEPEWRLEILPPIDLTQILDIINYLDNLPEVTRTELIPEINKPAIMVFLREPIYILDSLRELPQVAQVTEEITASNGAEARPRKAQIELSRKIISKQNN
jgi:cell division septum initiation protein DivIVA